MTRTLFRAAVLLAYCVTAAGQTAADPEESTQRLTVDDYGRVKSPGAPHISPDGSMTAYVLDDRIHVVPTAGGQSRAVTGAGSSASTPRWSGDGKALFFISDRSGEDQLWKLPVDTFGEAEQLSDIERGLTSIRLSRDESRLLLVYPDEPASPADEDEPEPWVIDRLQFKEDAGDGYLTEPPSDHLYLYHIAEKHLQQLSAGDYAETDPALSPNGERVVFVSNRGDDPDSTYSNNLWLLSADTVNGRAEPARLTDNDAVKRSPAFSPDGREIAYLSAEDGVYGISRLAIVSASGGEPRMLTTALDRWVTEFRFSADGRSIYFLFENRGAAHLARVSLQDGKIETLLDGDWLLSALDVDAEERVVVLAATGNSAAELYRVERGRLERLTHSNTGFFASRQLGRKEKVSYPVADGTEVDAFITFPPGFERGRRYPAILHLHGGPVGQFSWGFDFAAEFYAANGYVVVQPNPRGSSGRGQDYVRAIYRSWGVTDYPDVIGAVDHLIELGYADPERLAVTGYSYGGYLTNVVITRTDRFSAAASGAGHSLIAANYGHDIYQKWYNWELGMPSENREKYDRLSPFTQVHRVTTPTIFLGGRDDWNVPVLNAELMYQGLRHRGIESRLVVYPDTHHGGWSERYDKDYLTRVIAWFDRFSK